VVDLSSLRDELIKVTRLRVEKADAAMTRDLKRSAPVGETAELKRQTGVEITSVSSNRITSEARSDAPYAEFVIQGTRPHVIRAKRGSALRFHWPKAGGVVFFAKVNHPGNAPNPFFKQVIGRWADYLRRAQ
jgi:hypothetical protein